MRNAILSLSLAALTASATAQCFDPSFGTSLGFGGDVMYPMQPIGFAFPLGGASYTDIHITDKGQAYFSNGGTPVPGFPDFSATAAELVGNSPSVCPLWGDIQCLQGNSGEVFIKSTATTCTVTWANAQCYAATSGIFNVQMELSITGSIKFLYGPGATNNSAVGQPTWQVAIVGISPGLGATLPVSVDLSSAGSVTTDTVFEEFTLPNTFDMANNGLLLIPTSPGWTYVPLGAPVNCASVSNYGTGCVQKEDTVHEYMTAAAFDLGGATLTFLRQGNGYLLLNSIPGTFVTPSGTAQVVADFDDVEETVTLSANMPAPGGTTSSLTICSNGRIALSGSMNNGASFFPDVPTFLDFPETTIAADWHDYNPGAGGDVKFEEAGGFAYVTWDNVFSYGTTSPSTFQYQFNLTTGDCTIVYGAYNLVGNDHLVGFSAGGVSPTSLVVDMSAFPAPVSVADSNKGLGLEAANAPTLGNPAFTLTTTNVPPVFPLAFTMFGDTAINPGIDLTFLGMATCFAYTNANLTSVSFPVVGATGSLSFGIPNNPTLIGATLASQSIALSLDTVLGLISSNGTTFTVGN